MNLLTVIPFSANDAVLAEHLCDYIYLLNRRAAKGSVSLVVAGDVHGELRERVRLAASMAFESVDLVQTSVLVSSNKHTHVNHLFRAAAEHVKNVYRVSWLWLEPDAVPLKAGWLDAIARAHYAQPRRYSGSWLKANDLFLARIAVYPPDAITDLDAHLRPDVNFSMISGSAIIPRSTKTRLVQEVAFYDESTNINPDAVVLHRDRNAVLMASLREKFEKPAKRK